MEKFIKWFENLTQKSLEQIEEIYAENAFFKDPFNEIKGRENIKKIFTHMFESPLENNKFTFIEQIANENKLFVTWDYTFSFKNKEYKIHGSSHLKFENNKCIYHRDYWDTGEELYLKVPILSFIHKKLSKNFKIKI